VVTPGNEERRMFWHVLRKPRTKDSPDGSSADDYVSHLFKTGTATTGAVF
jgi:hypothetical protein